MAAAGTAGAAGAAELVGTAAADGCLVTVLPGKPVAWVAAGTTVEAADAVGLREGAAGTAVAAVAVERP